VRRVGAALLLVTVGWLASPSPVPVYDGVGSPDEPYKYVGRSPAPVTATVTGPASTGLQLRSAESGPQVLVDLGAGAFTGSAAVTMTATPVAGDGTKVPQGAIDGNIYRITVNPGAVLQPEVAQGFLFLRAAVMTRPDPVVVHRATASDPWTAVKTVRAGQDILSTPFRALGDYAVVRTPGSKPLSAGGGLSTGRVLLLGGGVLVLVLLTIWVLRRSAPEQT
jgi:hypothetical protein